MSGSRNLPDGVCPDSGAEGANGVSKMSIYLDGSTDEFLEAVRVMGRASQPRVDATRSAVVRLAIAKLARDFSPAQVVEELLRCTAHNGPGRPRR